MRSESGAVAALAAPAGGRQSGATDWPSQPFLRRLRRSCDFQTLRLYRFLAASRLHGDWPNATQSAFRARTSTGRGPCLQPGRSESPSTVAADMRAAGCSLPYAQARSSPTHLHRTTAPPGAQ